MPDFVSACYLSVAAANCFSSMPNPESVSLHEKLWRCLKSSVVKNVIVTVRYNAGFATCRFFRMLTTCLNVRSCPQLLMLAGPTASTPACSSTDRLRRPTPLCFIWPSHKAVLMVSAHTHTFNGPMSGTTWVSRYQKGITNLDFTEARDSEWQWHQLGHMQVCISIQTDNHASTPPLSFLQAGCPSCRQTNSV